MRKLIISGLLVGLAACNGTQGVPNFSFASLATGGAASSILNQLRTAGAADLAGAQAKANAAGDDSGALCWKKLAPVVSTPGSAAGIATTLEDARIVQQAVAGACGNILPISPAQIAGIAGLL